MINNTSVVAYQDENNVAHFLVSHLDEVVWTTNPMLSEQFESFQLARDALLYIETLNVSNQPRVRFGMVVMDYNHIMKTTNHWLEEILDRAVDC